MVSKNQLFQMLRAFKAYIATRVHQFFADHWKMLSGIQDLSEDPTITGPNLNPAEYDPECDPYFWYCRWHVCWDWKDHCDLYLESEEDQGWVGDGTYWMAFEEREAEWELDAWREQFGFPTGREVESSASLAHPCPP